MVPAGAAGSACFEARAAPVRAEEIILTAIREPMLGGRGIDAHAADRIDRGRGFGFVGIAIPAAAAGRNLRRAGMAGVRRIVGVLAVCVIVIQLRHRNSRGLLICIP
jgi:hypothetical protein